MGFCTHGFSITTRRSLNMVLMSGHGLREHYLRLIDLMAFLIFFIIKLVLLTLLTIYFMKCLSIVLMKQPQLLRISWVRYTIMILPHGIWLPGELQKNVIMLKMWMVFNIISHS